MTPLQILGHPCGQVIQPRALLHHPGRDMSGLPVHLQPYRQAPHSVLLPPAAGNRPVPGHELLCSGHQGTLFSVFTVPKYAQLQSMLRFTSCETESLQSIKPYNATEV